MNKQEYTAHIVDGVCATITIKAKSSLIEPFSAIAKCPSKYCRESFNLCDEDAKTVRMKLIDKIKNHWTKVHKKGRNGKGKESRSSKWYM